MLQLHLSDQQFYCLLKCGLYQRFDCSDYTLPSQSKFDGNVILFSSKIHWSGFPKSLLRIWQQPDIAELNYSKIKEFDTLHRLEDCIFRITVKSPRGRELIRPFMKSFLTLNVRGPSYLSLTRLMSWLLKPWLLMSPGHQQPWYWLCRICRTWSYLRKHLKYLCQINVK